MNDREFLEANQGLTTTYLGREMDILRPWRNTYTIDEIAHHLSMVCRYNGSVRRFYSVAEHAYLCSHICDDDVEREALHHDDGEHIAQDIIRPIEHLAFMEPYRRIIDEIDLTIACQLGYRFPFPPAVKVADDLASRIEKFWLKRHGDCPKKVWPFRLIADGTGRQELPGGRWWGWSPAKAKRMYLRRHYQLFGYPKRRFFFGRFLSYGD